MHGDHLKVFLHLTELCFPKEKKSNFRTPIISLLLVKYQQTLWFHTKERSLGYQQESSGVLVRSTFDTFRSVRKRFFSFERIEVQQVLFAWLLSKIIFFCFDRFIKNFFLRPKILTISMKTSGLRLFSY